MTPAEVVEPVWGADGRTEAVLRAIRAHAPGDAREARSVDEVGARLATLARPFDRSAGPVHVTASGIVVGARGVVLHRHRRLHRWLQPGGHLEPGEWPADAARRECDEETGLTVRHPVTGPLLVHVDVHDAADDHVHLDLCFLLVGPDADPAPPPDESQEVAWFPWEEALALADVALTGALRTARNLVDGGVVEVPGG
jgi:8-oxo-dGTP pyrophosphatase MutT (NUDIX family)